MRSMRNASPDLIRRAPQPELQEWEQRMEMERLGELPSLKAFANCAPVLGGSMKDGEEEVDIGKMINQIDYRCGVLAECEPSSGTLNRWAEDNRLRYAVWFSDPQKAASLWKRTAYRTRLDVK